MHMLREMMCGLFAIIGISGIAQINGYARVTGISGNVCTIGAAQEAFGSFTTGKRVIIIQMQGDIIGENTFNNAEFGRLGSIGNTGRSVVREITGITRSGSTLTSVTLDQDPGITFDLGPSSNVQLITYERLGNGGDHTTTANIGALPWNGQLGGVVAFYVEGTLTLAHNVSADLCGFRGGSRTITGSGACDPSQFVFDSAWPDAEYHAGKGESIQGRNSTAWDRGRGRSINGGGGGSSNNAGGGGGANHTAGGEGGAGNGCSSDPAGGLGGVALGAYADGGRLFLGGGGGGGEGDTNASSVGARGGGIVIIKADGSGPVEGAEHVRSQPMVVMRTLRVKMVLAVAAVVEPSFCMSMSTMWIPPALSRSRPTAATVVT